METHKPRILVVDDEDDIVYSLKNGLEQRGFSVDAYTDPLLALANYKPSEYSLCLLDIRMPKLNGFELYREIRKLDHYVKMCFCTAHDLEYRDEFHKALPELDERTFIPKPCSLSELVGRIEQELEKLESVARK